MDSVIDRLYDEWEASSYAEKCRRAGVAPSPLYQRENKDKRTDEAE